MVFQVEHGLQLLATIFFMSPASISIISVSADFSFILQSLVRKVKHRDGAYPQKNSVCFRD